MQVGDFIVQLRVLVILVLGVIVVAFTFLVASAPRARARNLASAIFNDTKRAVFGDTRYLTLNDQPIQCWGDSLTSGYGASYQHDYPSILANFHQRKTLNYGIPKESSVEIKARFLARNRPEGPESVVIWAGRNDSWLPDQVIGSVGAMVASLNPGSRFLVLGVTTSDAPNEYMGEPDHSSILKINAALADAYGELFIPINDRLLAKSNRRFEEDRLSVSRGTIPRSLRSDRLHLNDAGTLEVAVAVNDAFVRQGW